MCTYTCAHKRIPLGDLGICSPSYSSALLCLKNVIFAWLRQRVPLLRLAESDGNINHMIREAWQRGSNNK